MSDYEKKSIKLEQRQTKELEQAVKAISRQSKVLEDIRKEIVKQTETMDRKFSSMDTSLKKVGDEVRLLKDATIDLEGAKALAIMDTKREQLFSAEKIWTRAKERFGQQYNKIVLDYVKGIKDNIERFCRLVSDELAPMFRIKRSTSEFLTMAYDMLPRSEDKLRVEAAIAMSGMREPALLEKYEAARSNLMSFIEERKALVDKIEAAKSKIGGPILSEQEPGTIVLLRVPVYLTLLEGSDGYHVYSHGPQELLRTTTEKGVPIPKIFSPIASNLESSIRSSPSMNNDRLIDDARNTNVLTERASKIFTNTQKMFEALFVKSDVRVAFNKFYGPDMEQWEPDSRCLSGGVES